MYTCQISNKINLSKAITTSDILSDLLSDAMLFDLDMRKENLELSLLYATLTVTQIRFSGSVTLSGGQDWKATLRVPPPDTRYQTGAFCISVLEKIDPNTNVIQTMILVPTRELALQTSQVCKELSKYLNIQVMVTTGGTSLRDDIKRLHQPIHLLVGTLGRILDLTKKGVCFERLHDACDG
ncbi:unnamed protein product [Brassica oleracea var. botrytis]|nr:unnamed protein product [Brassica oleracea]